MFHPARMIGVAMANDAVIPPPPGESDFPELRTLIGDLRRAAKDDDAAVVRLVTMSAARINEGGAYAQGIRAEVRRLLKITDSAHLLTEVGILADEGLYHGTVRRAGARLAPVPTRGDDLEQVLATLIVRRDEQWVRALRPDVVQTWIRALFHDTEAGWDDPSELASALMVLATRIAGAGLNARLVDRMLHLQRWTSPFLGLSRAVNRYAERLADGQPDAESWQTATLLVDQCIAQVESFRDSKTALGTTIELSSHTLRMQQQLRRLHLLLDMVEDDEAAWSEASATLMLELLVATARRLRIRDFVREKLDLLAYLTVGHAARKGEGYEAHTTSDFRKFLFKSTLGGFLVAIFASLKIHLSHGGLAPVPQGLLYGLNYAVCFALIFFFGATLATKQPAVTASRLAHALESGGRSDTFARLVRAIWRSQFISFVGNIAGAAAFSVLFAVAFQRLMGTALVGRDEAIELMGKLHPFESLSLYYAAIAGVLLSSAGFFAGWVDNAVVFHRLADRIAAGTGVFVMVPRSLRRRMASRVDHKLGALSGNLVLGFMLGIAGTVGVVTGLPVDIRHVAFASSQATLGIFAVPEMHVSVHIATMLVAVVLVGLVNFLVSFGLTLFVAIESRKVEGVDWRRALRSVLGLILRQPFRFFFPLPDKAPRASSEPGPNEPESSESGPSESGPSEPA